MNRSWYLVLTPVLLFAVFSAIPNYSLASVDAMAEGISQSIVAEEIPDDWEEQIDEKTKDLPEEVRETIREKIKESIRRKLAEKEAKEKEAEDSDDKDKTEEKKPEEDKEAKEETGPKKDPASEEAKKLKSEMDLYTTRFKYQVTMYEKQIEAQRLENEKSKIDQKLEADRIERQMIAMKRERDRLKLELDLAKAQSSLQKAKNAAKIDESKSEKELLEMALTIESAREKMEDRVLGDEDYPLEPFKNGMLRISTRRIELNGPIMSGAADYICQRIHYFNNKSDKPIFIVIDSCPGGSVIEGFQIVQAMQNSEAPIHVVVKRYAASMAAIITTLSDHSYCYPNAIVLHHQATTVMYGNGRDIKDQVRQLEEISDRLLGPVAAKQGMEVDEFVDLMYKQRTSGDWDVFGEEAVERKWVDHIVTSIREEALRKRPGGIRIPTIRIRPGSEHQEPTGYLERYEVVLPEEVDEKGKRFVRLPRLSPVDAWMIYNPDNYYR